MLSKGMSYETELEYSFLLLKPAQLSTELGGGDGKKFPRVQVIGLDGTDEHFHLAADPGQPYPRLLVRSKTTLSSETLTHIGSAELFAGHHKNLVQEAAKSRLGEAGLSAVTRSVPALPSALSGNLMSSQKSQGPFSSPQKSFGDAGSVASGSGSQYSGLRRGKSNISLDGFLAPAGLPPSSSKGFDTSVIGLTTFADADILEDDDGATFLSGSDQLGTNKGAEIDTKKMTPQEKCLYWIQKLDLKTCLANGVDHRNSRQAANLASKHVRTGDTTLRGRVDELKAHLTLVAMAEKMAPVMCNVLSDVEVKEYTSALEKHGRRLPPHDPEGSCRSQDCDNEGFNLVR
jgi:hypothetical protein